MKMHIIITSLMMISNGLASHKLTLNQAFFSRDHIGVFVDGGCGILRFCDGRTGGHVEKSLNLLT